MTENEVIKAALKATLHSKCDHIVYVDGNGAYGFARGAYGKLPNSISHDAKVLGWTEFSEFFEGRDFPNARYVEFATPISFKELIS